MPRVRMHADEVEVDAALVRRLLAGQFPEWAALRMVPVSPWGTDNALYRVGDELVVRLPRTPRTEGTLRNEREWLPRLAPMLPLEVPVPVVEGAPGEGYPFTWSIYRWLEGEPASEVPIAVIDGAVTDLASFVDALRAIDTAGGPEPGAHNAHRGVPLRARDEATCAAIAALEADIDARAAMAAWEDALAAPESREPVWIHGDLDARNLLVRDGRLGAVVDFGCVGIGDAACDVMVAWKLFPADGRRAFCARLGVDDATWSRARGWALSQAVMALSYYTPETNPTLVREARRWLAEALADG